MENSTKQLVATTIRSDIDDRLHLRPPSPSEIRLQYSLGIAYGARGFLAYPYGFDHGYASENAAFPGIVSGDVSATDHASDFDTLFGRKNVWTGYREKWYATAGQNARLEKLSAFLDGLKWNAAKSWTMQTPGWVACTTQTRYWDPGIVTDCAATVASDYRNDLCMVEIGHLTQGTTNVIVVVNRRCAPDDKATITLTLSRKSNWRVTDFENTSHQWRVSGGRSFQTRSCREKAKSIPSSPCDTGATQKIGQAQRVLRRVMTFTASCREPDTRVVEGSL